MPPGCRDDHAEIRPRTGCDSGETPADACLAATLAQVKTRGFALGIAASVVACNAPATTPAPPPSENACESLAYVFFLVAENRDRGRTREEQVEMMRASVDNPFAKHPEKTLRSLLGVVDLVYQRTDASADEIRDSVLHTCSVDETGRAILSRPRG